MATPIYVTATTTLVQVDTTLIPGVTTDHVVILPSINAPGALITIRDIAGFASLTNRIVIQTAPGISFLGTTQTSISITQPYGTITVTPRTTSVWAILNTFAFPEASQAANMVNITTQNLTAEQSYLDNAIISTALISTLSTDNVFIRANLSVGQSTIAHAGFYVCSLRTLEDMLVGGVLYAGSTVSSIFANVTSTLTVPYISTQNIEIYGVLRSASTISTMGPIFAGSSISTTGNLAVGGSTFVQGELKVLQNVIFQSSLSTLYSLGVGREAMFYSSLTVKDNILTNGHLSTMSNVNVGGALSVMKSAFFTGQISTQSNLTVGGALSVMSTFYTYGDAVLNSSLYVRSGVSTLSNVYIASSLSVGGDLAVYGDLFFNDRVLDLRNLSVTQDLFVNNNISTYSSITAGLGLRIMGSTFLMGPVSTMSNMNIGGGLSTMKDLAVTGAAYIQSNLVIQSTLSTMGHMNLTGFLSTLSSGSIGHNLEVGRDLMVKSSLNVLGSTMLQSSVFITGSLSVFSSVAVSCNLDVGNLLRVRGLNTDVLRVSTLGVVRTDGFVLNVSSSTLHFGLFSTFGSMDIGGRVSTTRELVVGSTIDTQFINVRRNLSTTGDAYIGSNLFVLSSIQSGASTIVNGGLYVGNDVVLAEAVRMKTLLVTQTAVITGVTSINNNANILRTLTVRGGVTITNESGQQSQNLISNDTYMSSLKVSSIINYNFQSTLGPAAFYSSMQIQGHLSVFSTLAAACNADVGALLTASSIATRALQVSTMNIVQQTDFTLNVSSSTLHCGLFSTSGAIFSGAPISTMGSLAVGDNVNFYRNLTVGGNTVTDGIFQVRGSATLSNILNVGQAATLSNTLAVGSATTLSNTLNVGSATTLSNTLRVAEATTLSNTLAVGSATTLSNTLNVGLATTLSNTLDVGSVTTLSNTLRVGNATTLSNTLDVIGATTLRGTLTVTGNIRTLGNDAVAFGNGAGITNQAVTGVAIGSAAGATSQGNYGIAIGSEAGKVSQLSKAIAIGQYAGSNNQKMAAVAIGAEAGRITQGEAAVALGVLAGNTNQANTAIAIGAVSGNENQSESAIAIGASAGYSAQGLVAVAIGSLAGGYSQGQNSIAIGASAGNLNQGLSAVAIGNTAASSGQGEVAVAIGARAGFTTQGYAGVAIGNQAGSNNQGLYSLAIGHQAGTTSQGDGAVALGLFAGKTSQAASAIAIGQSAGITSQKINAIAIGCNAGTINQGQNSIAIGASAGAVTQVDNSIILNASGANLNAATTGLFVNPIRNTAATSYLKYNTTTSEISYVADSNLTVGTLQRFILTVGAGGMFITSNYGTSYTNITHNNSTSLLNGTKAFATNGKIIVAVGMTFTPPLLYSTDGINWNSSINFVDNITAYIINDVIWDGRQFVAAIDTQYTGPSVFDTGLFTAYLLTSPDGINWSMPALPLVSGENGFYFNNDSGNCKLVAFNGYYYMLCIDLGGGPKQLYKYDPSARTVVEVPNAFTSINKIFWTGSVWLIGGAGSYNLVSYNGTSITQIPITSPTVIEGIASDGSTIVAAGVTSVFYTTGSTWTTLTNPLSGTSISINDVIWDGTNFVLFYSGGNKLARSRNGINWTFASGITPDILCGFAFTYSAVQTLANNGLLATDSISTTGFVTIGDSLRVGQSTLVVQDSTRSMGVNCNSPSYPVDVNGIINAKFIYQDGAPYQPPPTTGAVTIINLTVSTVTAGTSMSVANTTVPNRILILGQTNPVTGSRLYTGTTPTNMTINNTALTGTPVALNAAYYTGTSWFMGGQAASSALLYSSPDSAAWTLITPAGSFPNSAVNAIVYNGLYYLVCGTDTSVAAGIAESRSIVKSDNMTSFTASSSTAGSFAFKSGANAAAWNGTLWVAVGSDSTSGTIQNPTVTIKYSNDGITWSSAINSFTASSASKGNTVVWNGVVFVAGGTDTSCTLKYSSDGITWYNCKGTYGLNPTKVIVWSGKRFVAVQIVFGPGTNIFYSDDGITWSASAQSISYGTALIWTGSQFILGTSKSATAATNFVSTDGVTWTEQAPSPLYDTSLIMNSLAYSSNTVPDMKIANTNFFSKQPQILGNSSNTNTIMSFSNGLAINNLYSETTGRVGINNNNPTVALDLNGFAKFNNTLTPSVWISMGNDSGNANSYIFASVNDGSNWTQVLQIADPNTKGLCWDGKRWLAIYYTTSVKVITSTTGFNWTTINTTGLTTFGYANKIIWTGTYYIAVGSPSPGVSDAPIVRSLDGITWTTTLGSFANGGGGGSREGRGIAYNGRMLVATGSHVTNSCIIQYSLDHGYTWIPTIHPIVGVTGRCVATNGRVWVVGYDGGIVYSYDGITFVAANSASYSGYCFDIAWNGSVFVAVGQDSVASIKYSYDGINWSPAAFVTALAFKGIGWNGSFFTTVVAATNGQYYSSQNGINWTATSANSSIIAPRTIMFSSNVVPDLQVENLGIYGKGQVPVTSTNTIALTPSTMVLNNTVTVSQSGFVGVNCNAPRVALDVAGSINFTGVINSNGNPVVFTPPGINSSGNLAFNSLPSQLYNTTFGGTTAAIKDTTFFGATTISGSLSSTPAIFVGSGASGPFTPGLGRNAILDWAYGCAVGQDGTIYVLNNSGQNGASAKPSICKITPNGAVTLLAGSLTQGYTDGTGSAASFNGPYAATLGLDGSLYVTDNLRIRRVTPSGVVTTVFTNTNTIGGICIDVSGNIYFTETFAGFAIKRIAAGSTVATVFVGSGTQDQVDGTGTGASFYAPRGLAIDLQGTMYLGDYSSVRKITSAGVVTTLAGNTTSTGQTLLTLQTNTLDTAANPQTVTVNGSISHGSIGDNYLPVFNLDGTITYVNRNIGAYFNNAASPWGNYISIPFTGGATFTIAYGFYVNDTGYYNPWGLSSTATGSEYGINPDYMSTGTLQKFNLRFTGGIVAPQFAVTPTTWIHVALTVNTITGEAKAYKNGLLQSTVTGTGSFINASYLLLGRAGDSARGFNGYLRNFYVFNTILSQANIRSLANDITVTVKNAVGNSDGQGREAGFNLINGVTCDIQGNVYVVDSNNYKIKKITPTGLVNTIVNGLNGTRLVDVKFDLAGNLFYTDAVAGYLYKLPNVQRLSTNPSIQVPGTTVTLFAGSGAAGSTDGLGAAATFYNPHGIYPAPDGFIYVIDYGNHKIRRIDASGNVTTFAGTGVGSFANGARLSAQFNRPQDCVMDGYGNLYVVDTANVRIRKIDASGNVTTFAGSGVTGDADGIGAAASFREPSGITIGGGNLYVTDFHGNRIRKIVISTAAVTTLAGSSSGVSGLIDGIGGQTRFYYPTQIAYGPDGFLYVATINAVRKVSMTGVVTTLAGSSTAGYLDGLGTAAQFNRPYGLAIDALGNVFVSENTNKTIRKITPAGLVTTFLKTTYEGMYRISIDSGNLYISEFNNNRIYKVPGVAYLDPEVSIPTMSASTITSSALTIQNGITLATTNPANLANIQVPGTTPTVFAGSGAAGSADGLGTAATFNVPYGVYAAPNGFIYVCDYSNHCIRRIDASGNVTRIAGLAGTSGSADGNGTTARFNFPEDCVMDSNGNLYIVDTGNQTIRKIDVAGNVSTFAGQALVVGGTNGTGTAATFNGPTSITIAGDSLYVSEYFPGRVRRIVIATQAVTTLAGDGIGGLADATGTAASFSSAAQITYGADGFLYLANTNAIRRISLSGVVTTFVGGQAAAYLDGVGRAAQINAPQSLAFDSLRNLYVAELNTGRIRKVSPEGVVTTFYTGTFTQIYRISVDSGNNLYVADYGNNKIYKFAAVPYVDPTVTIPVAAASTITTNTFNIKNGNNTLATTSVISGNIPSNYPITFAGSGAAGSADGTGLAATFQSIHGVRAAPDGTIYVFENVTPGRIRRITQDGVVTTLTSSLTSSTQSGDIDAEGNVYCQDGNAISKVTPAGVITLVAGDRATAGFTNGTGAAARLRPRSIALGADGHLYVADSTNNCIRKVELPTGVVTTFAGSATGESGFVNGQGTAARFSNCDSIVSGVDGNLYMVDRLDGAAGNSSLRKITLGGLVTTVAGSSTLGYADAVGTQARFRNPISLSIDPLGNFYLVDQLTYMRKITPSGEVSRFYTGFTRVYHMCVDKYGNLFIGEYDQHVIKKFPAVAYYDATMSIAKTSSSTITANTITNSNLYLTETATTKIDIARQKIPMLVAIGGNDNSKPERMIQYSTDDGLTWKNAISGGFKQQGMSGVLYNGSMWVAVGQNGGAGNIQWSMDGINWNYALSESNSSFAIAVGWNGKMWLVSNQLGVNSPSGLNTYFLQYSYDGKNWSRINGFTNQFRTNSFAWSDNLGLWVAVGESGYGTLTTLQWSTDGFTWNNATSGGFAGAMPGAGNTGGCGVAWCGGSAGSIGYFIAVGAGSTVANTILKSTDGKNWTNSTSGGFGIQGAKVAWCPYLISGGAGIWIAVGNNNSTTGQVKYSTNGLTWSDIGPVWTANSSAQSIVWTGTSFVAGGDNQAGRAIQISKNGSSWYPAKSNFIWNCSAIGVGYGSETINTVATVGNTRLLGNLFVGSSNVESPGSFVTNYSGSGPIGFANGTVNVATYEDITSVCSDSQGRIYVYAKRDGATREIRRIENGTSTTLITPIVCAPGPFPTLHVSPTGTLFYVRCTPALPAAGPYNGTVLSRRITSDGGATYGAEADIISGATNITACHQSYKNINLLYYVDQYAIYTSDGTITRIAGSRDITGNTDSINGFDARFGSIYSICIDSTETYMYILDAGNHRIRRMTLMDPYEVITYAGSGAGFADGFRLDAKFSNPLGMALDSNNNIYVGDELNHRVRFVDTSTGMVYSAAGRGGLNGLGGYTNGTGESAQFYYPRGLTVNTDGYIYVGTLSGASEVRVRKMSPFYPNMTAINGTVNINTAPDFRYALSVKGNINTNGGSISFIKDQSDNLDGAPMDGIGYYSEKLPGYTYGFPLKFGGFYGTVFSSGNGGGVSYPYTMVLRDGNVGIGTKSPNSKLQVDGGIYAVNYSLNGGNLTGRTGGLYNYRSQAESSIYQSINWLPSPANGNAFDFTSQGACGIICSAFSGNASIRFYVTDTPVAGTAPTEAMSIRSSGVRMNLTTLYIGTPNNSSQSNLIRFAGTADDAQTNYMNSIIGERIYGGGEVSELILYKGDDRYGGAGPDRVRVLAAGGFQVDVGLEGSWIDGGNCPAATISEALKVNPDGSTTVYGGFHSLRGISCAGNVAVCGNGSSATFTCGIANGNTIATFYTDMMYVGIWTEAKYGGSSAYNPRATEIRSGVSVFNGGNTPYVSGADLSLGGQNLYWVGNAAESARIVVEGGRAESATPRDNNIFFYTNGSKRCTINSGGLSTPSDERLKTNIETLTNVLSSIKQVRGIRYNLKSDPENAQIGVIAQEIEVVFPELIHTDDSNEKIKSMNYQNLTGVLLQAINEQQVLIESQQSTINAILQKYPV
jgi:sugar lactone lactonase YvrE